MLFFSFVNNNCSNKVKKPKKFSNLDYKFLNQIKSKISSLRDMMNDQNLNSYIKSVIEISFITNKYINDMEPWTLKKKDLERMNTTLYVSLDQIAKISILLKET